jgi:4-hydroxy-tetrahydrodipicolinate synthase
LIRLIKKIVNSILVKIKKKIGGKMMKKIRLDGVQVVIPTPFNKEGEFDRSAESVLRDVIDFVIEKGVTGIIPAGGAGEFFSLTEAERKRLFDICIEQVGGRVSVCCGTGATTTKEVINYNRYAKEIGAVGVMLVTPYYSLPTTEEIFRFYATVAEAVDILIMMYNDPFPTGVDMKPDLVARLAEIDNIVAIKESSGDLRRVREIKDACGNKIDYLFGDAYPVVDAYILGADGWVTGASFPAEAVEIHRLCVEKRDFAAAKTFYDQRLRPVLKPACEGDITSPSAYIAKEKASFELLGFKVGAPRAPLSPLDEKGKKRLAEQMKQAGLLS